MALTLTHKNKTGFRLALRLAGMTFFCLPLSHAAWADCPAYSENLPSVGYKASTGTLMACNGTSWTPVDTPYAQYYSDTLVAVNPSRNTWFDASGATLTIPKDGVYQVSFSTRLWCLVSGDAYWIARLYNATTASLVISSFGLGYVPNGIFSCQGDQQANGTRILRLYKNNIIKLQFYVAGSGNADIYTIGEPNTGGTSITALWIAN